MKGKQWVSRAARRIRVACPEVYFAPLNPESRNISLKSYLGPFRKGDSCSETGLMGQGKEAERVIVGSYWLNSLSVFFTRFDQIGMGFLSSRGWCSLGVPGPGLAHKGC